MISIILQERLLGAALGAAFTSAVIFENRRAIYNSISGDLRPLAAAPQPKEQKVGRISSDFAREWNKAVDGTLGQVVVYLSSRGW